MANMSYCMCENTAKDLADVVQAVQDKGSSAFNSMSTSERQAAVGLYKLCQEYIDLYETHGQTTTGEDEEE